MLKNRLIPVLFLKNGFLVRSEKFRYHQNLGNPIAQVERYNAWDVDELIYIDISEQDNYHHGREDVNLKNPQDIYEIIEMVASKCFMPLTFGGRIRSLEDIRKRMAKGADKITVNTQAIRDPKFITEAAKEFGSQAIIVSIDVLRNSNNDLIVYEGGKIPTKLDLKTWVKKVENLGAGEIFLNSINRDGTATGYDIELTNLVVQETNIPVIACGGVGDYKHFAQGIIDGNAAAVAAGNIFNFKELSYVLAKKALKKQKLNFR